MGKMRGRRKWPKHGMVVAFFRGRIGANLFRICMCSLYRFRSHTSERFGPPPCIDSTNEGLSTDAPMGVGSVDFGSWEKPGQMHLVYQPQDRRCSSVVGGHAQT